MLSALSIIAAWCPPASGYAVITHEAIIDAAWKDNIQPLLLKRFPNSTPDDLLKAQAYAYGGAIIQDMGYYPLGSRFFSDLTHYVRSGDFILSLLNEAQNLNDYAFALGALSHYAADTIGHREATNRAVPLVYPELKRKFGPVVTYEDNPIDHIKVEFSFDVVQVAQGSYAPQAYHSFVGFEVAQADLERAFASTYSLQMADIFHDEEVAIGTYRFAIKSILPAMTKTAWSIKGKEIQKAQPSMTRRRFIHNISRSEYRKSWGTKYDRPKLGVRFLGFLIRILPKVGPLKVLAFHAPPPQAENMFMKSFNDTLAEYRRLLSAYGRGELRIPNNNFDTGDPVKPGTYRMADQAFAKLLDKVNHKPMSPELRASMLEFFNHPENVSGVKKKSQRKKMLKQAEALKQDEGHLPAGDDSRPKP